MIMICQKTIGRRYQHPLFSSLRLPYRWIQDAGYKKRDCVFCILYPASCIVTLCLNTRVGHNAGNKYPPGVSQMNRDKARPLENHWIVLILSAAVSSGLAVWSGQDAGFDLLNYHYYSGFAFLHKSFGHDFAPAQIQSFHNPLMHVLSYLVLANLPAKAAAALLGAIQGLNFYLVFQISQVLFSEYSRPLRHILAVLCAAAGFYGIVSTTELGATYGDNLISILVLSGLLLILRLLRSGRILQKSAAPACAAAGFLAGAAFGLKFTSANYAMAFVLAVPLTLPKTQNWMRVSGALLCGLVIGFLATYGYWAANLCSFFGNPLFHI